jgi:hypothetical protein
MSKQIEQAQFAAELLALLDETFEHVHGYYLDKGTSLFETLEDVSAAEASRPISAKCACLAAQVAHVNFYLEVLERYIVTNENVRVDWQEIWRTVKAVTPEEWAVSKQKLKETYQRLLTLIRNFDHWDSEHAMGGAMALVTHTAYHLGEIRQALGVIKP